VTSFKEYYGTDKQSLLNEVIKAPFGAGNRVWNPWPDEPLPDSNDTRDYRAHVFKPTKVMPAEWVSLIPKEYVGSYNGFPQVFSTDAWNKLPQNEQAKVLDKVVRDYAAKAGISMSSTWGNDMKNKALFGDTQFIVHNLQHANDQALKNMTPEEQNKFKQEAYKDLPPQEQAKIRQQTAGKQTAGNKIQLSPQQPQSQPSQLAKAADIAYSANPTTMVPYNVGKALYNAGPGYAKAAYQSIANSPAIKPLNTSNIAQRVASNPLVRAANALSPANVVATGLGAYNNLKKNYDVNVGGSAGTSGVGIGGAITPKQTDLKRPSLYGGVSVTPGKGGWLTPTAQAYAGRVQYPTNIKAVPTSQPSATSLRSQPVAQTSTTTRPASTQAYLPSTRSTVQQPVQQTSYQQAPRYSKSSVPGAIAFFQRYGRWPSESEL